MNIQICYQQYTKLEYHQFIHNYIIIQSAQINMSDAGNNSSYNKTNLGQSKFTTGFDFKAPSSNMFANISISKQNNQKPHTTDINSLNKSQATKNLSNSNVFAVHNNSTQKESQKKGCLFGATIGNTVQTVPNISIPSKSAQQYNNFKQQSNAKKQPITNPNNNQYLKKNTLFSTSSIQLNKLNMFSLTKPQNPTYKPSYQKRVGDQIQPENKKTQTNNPASSTNPFANFKIGQNKINVPFMPNFKTVTQQKQQSIQKNKNLDKDQQTLKQQQFSFNTLKANIQNPVEEMNNETIKKPNQKPQPQVKKETNNAATVKRQENTYGTRDQMNKLNTKQMKDVLNKYFKANIKQQQLKIYQNIRKDLQQQLTKERKEDIKDILLQKRHLIKNHIINLLKTNQGNNMILENHCHLYSNLLEERINQIKNTNLQLEKQKEKLFIDIRNLQQSIKNENENKAQVAKIVILKQEQKGPSLTADQYIKQELKISFEPLNRNKQLKDLQNQIDGLNQSVQISQTQLVQAEKVVQSKRKMLQAVDTQIIDILKENNRFCQYYKQIREQTVNLLSDYENLKRQIKDIKQKKAQKPKSRISAIYPSVIY